MQTTPLSISIPRRPSCLLSVWERKNKSLNPKLRASSWWTCSLCKYSVLGQWLWLWNKTMQKVDLNVEVNFPFSFSGFKRYLVEIIALNPPVLSYSCRVSRLLKVNDWMLTSVKVQFKPAIQSFLTLTLLFLIIMLHQFLFLFMFHTSCLVPDVQSTNHTNTRTIKHLWSYFFFLLFYSHQMSRYIILEKKLIFPKKL